MKSRVRGLDGPDGSNLAMMASSQRKRTVFWCAVLALAGLVVSARWQREANAPAEPVAEQLAVEKAFGRLALTFEQNRGQVSEEALYFSRARGHSLFLTENEAVLAADGSENRDRQVVRMRWVGGREDAEAFPREPAKTRSNYYRGNDPDGWITGVPHYGAVRYSEVYEGVDLDFYSREGEFEFDFVVEPGADAGRIELEFSGQDRLVPQADGSLKILAGERPMALRAPFAYQVDAVGDQEAVEAEFRLLAENRVRFELGPYDAARPLVIDPIIEIGSYLGGTAGDRLLDIAVNAAGQIYVTGTTDSTDFPGDETSPSGSAFLASIAPGGTTIDAVSFFGGTSLETARAIALDGSSNVYITGETFSDDFPVVPSEGNPLTPSCGAGCGEAFVIKTDPNLNVLYASVFGGTNDPGLGVSEPVTGGLDIAVNAAGEAYVAGRTFSNDFPTVNAFKATFSNLGCASFEGICPDGFVTRLTADGFGILYSSYIGGQLEDSANGIAVDGSGNAYVVGATESGDFAPLVSPVQGTLGGGDDVFWVRVATNGSATFGTYLGDTLDQRANGVDLDASGNVYIVGLDEDEPLGNPDVELMAAGQRRWKAAAGDDEGKQLSEGPQKRGLILSSPNGFQPFVNGAFDGFLLKLGSDLSTELYSTYIGGFSDDEMARVVVDGSVAHIVGETSSSSFPTLYPLSSNLGGSTDATITSVDTSLTGSESLLFSTYYGTANGFDPDFAGTPTGFDTGTGIAVNSAGEIYIGGWTNSTFGIDINAGVQGSLAGGTDGFFAKLGPAMDVAPTTVDIGTFVLGSPASVTTVNLTPRDPVDITITSASSDFVSGLGSQFGLSADVLFPVDIGYAPTTIGSTSATLSVQTIAPNTSELIEEDFVDFSAVVVPATTITPNPLIFGAVATGTSAVLNLSVSTNAVVDVRLMSSNAEFVVGAGFTTLTDDGTNLLPVTYSPVTVGDVGGTITLDYFVTGDTTTPILTETVTVSGTGVAPFSLTPTSLDFGTVIINDPELLFPSLDITGNFDFTVTSDDPQFTTSFTDGNYGPTSTPIPLPVIADPDNVGPQTGNLTITAFLPGTSTVVQQTMVPLAMVGQDAFSLDVTSFDFGNVAVGVFEGARPFATLTANGLIDVTVDITEETSDFFIRFSSQSFRIGTGSTMPLEAFFEPSMLGPATATVTITATQVPTFLKPEAGVRRQQSSPLQTSTVILSGTGVLPATNDPTSFDFGSVAVGASSGDRVMTTVTRNGEVGLDVTSDNPLFVITSGSVGEGTTPVEIVGQFQPDSLGPQSATVTIDVFVEVEGIEVLQTILLPVTGNGGDVFTLSETELDFGIVDVGGREGRSVTVSPTTEASIRASTSGDAFSVSPRFFTGASTRELDVDFDPLQRGRAEGTLTVQALLDGVVVQSETVSLLGRGGNPITTGSGDLGTALLGCPLSRSLDVTSSTGLDYRLIPSTNALSVAPGSGSGPGTQAFEISITPAMAGAVSESVVVRADTGAGTADLTTVPLTGTVVELQPAPATIDFGAIDLGASSEPQVVELIRTPDEPIGLVLEATSDVADFVPTVAEGVLSIAFTPQVAGQVSGVITVRAQVANNLSCENTLVIPVSGAGGDPLVTVTPGAVSFGPIAVGLTSPAEPVELLNSSTVPLDGTASVPDAQFGITPTNFSVQPGESVTFQLTYTPAALGPATASVAFDLSGPGGTVSSLSASLAGDGAPAPEFSVAPGSIDFGEVVINTSDARSVTITNNGPDPADVTASATGPFTVAPGRFTVPAGASANASVAFNPVALGPQSGAAAFRVAGVTQSVNLNGIGLSTDPRLELRPEGGGDSALPGGSFSLSRTPVESNSNNNVQICNSGGGPGTLEDIAISGGDFAASDASLPASLDPGECLAFRIAFTPGALGEAAGQLTATGPGISSSYALTGVGVVPEVTLIELPGTSGGGLNPENLGLVLPGTEDVALSGVLTIRFEVNPAFAGIGDPNVALPGGASIEFFKPAGTAQAEFDGAPLTMFNTGTTAGIIGFDVVVDLDGVDVSPRNSDIEPDETTEIPIGPPSIVNVQLTNRSGTGFDVVVTGFSTAREVTGLQLQFTAAGGGTVDPSSLSADVSAPFVEWFETDNWQDFGSQFVFTQRVNISGDANAIGSVSVTLSNSQGSSNTAQANF